MKTLKNIFSILFLFAAVQVQAQTNKETTQRIIDAQNYVFVATTAIPMNSSDVNAIMNRLPGSNGGGNINLSGSNYDVSVTKDSLVTYLPYYGRSFVARIGDREGGIKFKSKDFSYHKQAGKKGSWTITMKPKDVRDNYNSNYSLTFNITANGYGTLVVTSNNQQPITFNGYLAEPKAKKN